MLFVPWAPEAYGRVRGRGSASRPTIPVSLWRGLGGGKNMREGVFRRWERLLFRERDRVVHLGLCPRIQAIELCFGGDVSLEQTLAEPDDRILLGPLLNLSPAAVTSVVVRA